MIAKTGSPAETPWDRLGGAPALQNLLRHFYADIRQDAVLGPIFNAHIHDWPAHLEKIGSFWARQLGAASNYPGGFAAAHLPLGIQPEHFVRWLGLWERNCCQHLNPESAAWMTARASDIAAHLRRVVGGSGGLQVGPVEGASEGRSPRPAVAGPD
ncbi:MAG: group III truncated hemoglobin [Verrucomicrobia bacterium]|nr:group III truncated hemoglobin [Verrucomicrobiota bacterium]